MAKERRPWQAGAAAGRRAIEASEFKARCLQLMDEVAESGEEVVSTRRGRPVPCREPPGAIFGAERGVIRIHGDIVEPLDVDWEAEVDPDRVLDP